MLERRADVPYTLWGDDESGYVNDLFYVMSAQMMLIGLTIPPGGGWRSSDKCRAFYDTHECVYVLKGQFTCQDPETGEVRTVKRAKCCPWARSAGITGITSEPKICMRWNSLHPPAAQGVLERVPRPLKPLGWDAAALNNWPRDNERGADNLRVCGLAGALDAIVGHANPMLCRVFSCTDQVFLGLKTLSPRTRSDDLTYPFDVCYYGMGGEVTVHLPDGGKYFAIHEADVGFLSAGTQHRLFNHTGATQQILIGGAGNFSRLSVTSP